MSALVLDRQGFLGASFEKLRHDVRIAIVGISGGGSHIVQQLAHLGFEQFLLFDPDVIGPENLHRHVGARRVDVAHRELKVNIGKRVIQSVSTGAHVDARACAWQQQPALLRACDLVFGSVDSFRVRLELEACARRYIIPYIDIGMDVFPVIDDAPPRMVGQVVLSAPGEACLRCLGVITDRELAIEAARYGGRQAAQQVVYANGMLASAAVGLALDYLTSWTGPPPPPYLQYDGNAGTITESSRLQYLPRRACPHYLPGSVGDPVGVAL